MALFRCMVGGGGGSGAKVYETTIENATTGTEYTIACGFTPKQIFIYGSNGHSTNLGFATIYDVVMEAGYQLRGGRTGGTIAQFNIPEIGATTAQQGGTIMSISSTGFVFKAQNRNIFTGDIYIKVLG